MVITYKGGKESYPLNQGSIPVRCPVCGGAHTVFNKDCSKGKKRWDLVKVLYKTRPVRFEVRRCDDTPI